MFIVIFFLGGGVGGVGFGLRFKRGGEKGYDKLQFGARRNID